MGYCDYFIPGYDAWKTSPPEEDSICECVMCGKPLGIGDFVYKFPDIDGKICEDCKEDYCENCKEEIEEDFEED